MRSRYFKGEVTLAARFVRFALGLAFIVLGCSSAGPEGGEVTPPAGTCEGGCDAPPASRCVGATSFESYAPPGSCVEGACQYVATRGECTDGQVCRDGVCVGDDASLASLEIVPGSIRFEGTQSHYVVTIPTATDVVGVTPVLGDAGASLFVDDQPATSGAVTAIRWEGNAVRREVRIRVVAASGSSSTYSVLFLKYGQQAYVKASNAEAGDAFGGAVAVSSDGTTLAVGSAHEDGSAQGIGGDQADNGTYAAGAVYVFRRDTAGVWAQEAYVKPSKPVTHQYFGESLALSADGATLAVGAPSQSEVYVFRRGAEGKWGEDVRLASGPNDSFGSALALSTDGEVLAIGAREEASPAKGINGNPNNTTAPGAGAAYVYRRSGPGAWSQEVYIKASNTRQSTLFGASLAMSADGTVLVVGSPYEYSNAVGVNGAQDNVGAPGSGAAYVFRKNASGAWSQEAYVKASNTERNDEFGWSVALSAEGDTFVVGAPEEDSLARSINGNQGNGDTVHLESGAAYVFRRASGTWAQEAYVKAANSYGQHRFGRSVALSSDGSMLAVGATGEDGAARGINGDPTRNVDFSGSGAAYVFRRSGAGAWSQEAYVKASNADRDDYFSGVALSGDGSTLVVGATGEASAARGVDGNQADNSAKGAGAAYVFAM